MGFGFSINPYRGCFHGCSYCYARPTHQYLDFGAGTDFERKIVVKVNAPELLRERFLKPSWRGDLIALSGNTDCYQPLEATYGITRRILEVCAEFRNPVAVITKAALIRRDVDVLCELARRAQLSVSFSIPFVDEWMARQIEPYAPSPDMRFGAMRVLAEAGIPVGVAVAPLIPGLNDSQVTAILERARDCGARSAFKILLRLPAEVKDVFIPRLRRSYPGRSKRVLNALKEMRGGALYTAQFGSRMRGRGHRWKALEDLFEVTCRRLGLNARRTEEEPTTFRRPCTQLSLLDPTP